LSDQAVVTRIGAAETGPAVRAFASLLRAQAVTTRLLSASLQEAHGLTINDFEALVVLSTAPDQRLKRVDLARRLLLTPSGITRLLEGLESAGLVERATCASDLRVTYAALTEKGRETLNTASCGHVASIRTLFEEHLSEEEIELLTETLGKLPGVAYGNDACASIETP
jgi:DNA-binding MarR family transcriptional regulator